MVTKNRVNSNNVPYIINDGTIGYNNVRTVQETMVDSSTTGSPRTDLDAVDQFLANPTNQSDFHKALQNSHKSAGDAGLASFRVDRVKTTTSPRSFSVPRTFPGIPSPGPFVVSGWTPRYSDVAGGYPTVELIPIPNGTALRNMGEQLYNRAIPNQDQSDLGTTLAEIITAPKRALQLPGFASAENVSSIRKLGKARDNRVVRELLAGKSFDEIETLHPRLRNLGPDDAKAAASDYLAYVFGARPTFDSLNETAQSINRRLTGEEISYSGQAQAFTKSVSSAANFAKAVSISGKKRIRRRRSLRTIVHTESVTNPNGIMYARSSGAGNEIRFRGQIHKFATAKQRTWFSGAFRMSTTDTDTWLKQSSTVLHAIDQVTGLGIDARVIWDLIPFSFMADWFANTGDFLSNRQVIADYNIACEYGYVMNHTSFTRDMRAAGVFENTPGSYAYQGSVGGSASYSYLEETKLRSSSNSFGFHTSYDSLNAFQWGALTAIGLSKVPGVRPLVRS